VLPLEQAKHVCEIYWDGSVTIQNVDGRFITAFTKDLGAYTITMV